MEENNNYQIGFMPYAPLNESIKIGKYEIWPFQKEADKKISDRDILKQLNKYFNRYFEFIYDPKEGGYYKNLESIYIITPENFIVGNDKYNIEQINNILSIGHILAFSSIFESGFGTFTSDNFLTIIQNFVKNQEGIKYWITYYSNYDLFNIVKPLYIVEPLLPFEPTKLCNVLARALEYRYENSEINKIFRTLELLFHTVTFGEMITDYHRLLTLVMAFEVLLNFENKKEFVEKIEKYTKKYGFKLEKRKIKISGNKEIETEKTLTGWWAFDLYNLRSRIIHGEQIDWEIKKYGDIWTRIKFAGSIFKRIIKIILKEQGFWKNDFVDEFIEGYSMDGRLETIVKEFLKLNPEIS